MRPRKRSRATIALVCSLALGATFATAFSAAAAPEALSFSIKEARAYAYKASLSKEVIEAAGRAAPCDPEEDEYECDEGRYNHKPNCPTKLSIGPKKSLPKVDPPSTEPHRGGAGDGSPGEEPPQSSPVRLNRIIALGSMGHLGPIKEAMGYASEQYVDLSGRSEPEVHTESDAFSPNKASYEERCFPKEAAQESQNDYTHVFSRSLKSNRTLHLAECFRRRCTFGAPSPGSFGAEAEKAVSTVDLAERGGKAHATLSAVVEELSWGSGALTVDSIETYVRVVSDGSPAGLKWSVTSTASGAGMGGQKLTLPPGEVVSGPGFSVGMAAPYVDAAKDGTQLRIIAPGLMVATEEQAVFFGGAELYASFGEGLDFSFEPLPPPTTTDEFDDTNDDFVASDTFDTGSGSFGGSGFGGGVAVGPSDTSDPLAASPTSEILIYEQATGRGAVAGLVALGFLGWVLIFGRWLQRYTWGRKMYRLQPFRTIDWIYRAFVKT